MLQSDAGWEEYYDYIFPEDSANQPNLKLMDMARMWSKKMTPSGRDDDGDEDITASDANGRTAVEKPLEPEATVPSADSPAPPESVDAANGGQQEYDDRDDSDSSSSSSEEEEKEGGDKAAKQSSDQEND